jgi:hypothetical protein
VKRPNAAFAVAVIFVTTCGMAQERPAFEYGTPAELKGIKSIFIDTGADLPARRRILKEILKQFKDVPDEKWPVLTDRREEAEVLLAYGNSFDTFTTSVVTTVDPTTGIATSSPRRKTTRTGTAFVALRLPGGGLRLLMDFSDEKRSRFEHDPETNFVRHFAKAYMEANGIERKK